jgi:flagellar basal body P-ring formation protein FlgA
MVINLKYIVTGLLCYLLLPVTGYAEDIQSRESIEHAAYMYAFEQVQTSYDNAQIEMEPLDSRLRLQACDRPLEAFTTNNRKVALGKQTIGVKCNSPVTWSLYVPVKVKVFRPVVITSRPLAANQLISKSDIRVVSLDIGSFNQGYVKNPEHIIGQQLKYRLSMGVVINPNSLKQQKIIKRGEMISLVAVAGKMEVRMSGTALSDGTLGQRVRVKNLSSKRVVVGVVDGPGVIKITM